MTSLNKVMLIGRLGKDPEARYTPAGKQVVKFSVAVDDSYTKDGTKVSQTEWVNIVAWGRLAEICNQYLVKGSLVYLEGKYKTDKWDDKDTGKTRYSTKVEIRQMQMLGPKSENTGQQPKAPVNNTPPPDDDIPF